MHRSGAGCRWATACLLAALTASLVLATTANAGRAPLFLLADASDGAAVHAWPGGPVVERVAGRTPLGSPSWLWMVGRPRPGGWARVVLPTRPNGETGWILVRHRRVVRTRTWVIGNIGDRRVTLMRGNHTVASFPAAIGASPSTTPTGRFSVTDLVSTGDPSGPFGWFAFGLSGHQPNLPPGWSGGDQLAIHGTNDPASIGTAASAGCLRVSAQALGVLKAHLRLGTPVVIARGGAGARDSALRASAAPPPAPPEPPIALPSSMAVDVPLVGSPFLLDAAEAATQPATPG